MKRKKQRTINSKKIDTTTTTTTKYVFKLFLHKQAIGLMIFNLFV